MVCAAIAHGLRKIFSWFALVCASLRRDRFVQVCARFTQGLLKVYARFAQSSSCLRNKVVCVNLEEVYAGLRMVYAGLCSLRAGQLAGASLSLHSTMRALTRKKCRSRMIRNRFLHLDRNVHRERRFTGLSIIVPCASSADAWSLSLCTISLTVSSCNPASTMTAAILCS
jgi:hypothetical protein